MVTTTTRSAAHASSTQAAIAAQTSTGRRSTVTTTTHSAAQANSNVDDLRSWPKETKAEDDGTITITRDTDEFEPLVPASEDKQDWGQSAASASTKHSHSGKHRPWTHAKKTWHHTKATTTTTTSSLLSPSFDADHKKRHHGRQYVRFIPGPGSHSEDADADGEEARAKEAANPTSTPRLVSASRASSNGERLLRSEGRVMSRQNNSHTRAGLAAIPTAPRAPLTADWGRHLHSQKEQAAMTAATPLKKRSSAHADSVHRSSSRSGSQYVEVHSGESYCSNKALFAGATKGSGDCANKCNELEGCEFYSIWFTGLKHWCRLTMSCSIKAHLGKTARIYQRKIAGSGELAPEAALSSSTFVVHHGPSKRFCADKAIIEGRSHGPEDCQAQCAKDESCVFYSIWLDVKTNWCKLTSTCGKVKYQPHSIAIFSKA